jgi:hypothetical protein
VQDDFRVRRNVTLNLGVRYEPSLNWTSEDKELSTFQPGKQSTRFPNMPPGPLYPGDYGLPESIVGNRLNNLAPRVGIAWDVQGNGKTSIRASFGVYYLPATRSIDINRFPIIQPFALDLTITAGDTNNIFASQPFNGVSPYPRPDISNIQALRSVPFISSGNHTSFALPWKTGLDQQWSFSVQRALAREMVLEVDYIGSSASHLYISGQANPAVYIPGQSTLANTQQRRRYPLFGAIEQESDAVGSNYNSLQVSLTKRYSHGVSVLGTYTWSKLLGVIAAEGAGGSGTRDPSNWRLDYGRHGYDIRQNSVTSVIWDLPFAQKVSSRLVRAVTGGWQVSGIAKFRSGLPFTVRSGRDNSLTGIGLDTADQVADWGLSGDRNKGQKIRQWFNAAAFVPNAIGTVGQVGINSLRGPGFWNLDFAVLREYKFKESKMVQFRGSFFNVFNHANLNNPNSTQSNPTFGQITSASDPRVIEFGLRFAF